MNSKILLIDDEESARFGFSRYLSKIGYTVQEASCLSEAKEALQSQRFDAVLLDLNLPDGSGLDWIIEVRESYPDIPIIIITGFGDVPIAVEAMRRGADNFLTKPVNMADLEVFLRKSLEIGTLRRKNLIDKRLAKKDRIFFGESPAMQEILDLATIASGNDSSLVISGETGSGKGVLAKWLHEKSSRSAMSFVEVNCSNLRGDLLVSELFGHSKGAFTSAVQEKQGLIEAADGGTLFLDEIGDMDIGVQAQFLKVIEEKQFRRLGEVKTRKSDFRLICATNRDLLDETRKGAFRKDLYFRINVLPIIIPPLRERPEDIPGLVRHVLENMGFPAVEITPEVMELLKEYPWPGNIRELRNVLERALLLSHGQPLTIVHFYGLDPAYNLDIPAVISPGKYSEIEESHIRTVLKCFQGNTIKASKALGMSRATLYRKLKKFRITQEDNS
jgi:DNA-binding NtrC family response regulator